MPFRRREGGDVSAIFVHAGAGFHSHLNEKIHLQACNDAAKTAMVVLKNGGSALDAVEMAIKLMEDREITNAGFGSNLTVDGTVECDATIVDHQGRSGAVGAISQIRNPISLARIVLESSTKPLSLHRVPPNLLVGPGATDFAYSNGVPILPHDFLISPPARERWLRWRHDLQAAQQKEIEDLEQRMEVERQHEFHATSTGHPAGTHSATQLITPSPSVEPNMPGHRSIDASSRNLDPTSIADGSDSTRGMQASHGPAPNSDSNSYQTDSGEDEDCEYMDDTLPWEGRPSEFLTGYHSSAPGPKASPIPTSSSDMRPSGSSATVLPVPLLSIPTPNTGVDRGTHAKAADSRFGPPPSKPESFDNDGRKDNDDDITDTVGAIAVDCYGNIAAGSSSGGIGMKHRGRVGPAALVGVGTAVIPVDPSDPDKTCVATVTSGTGEHMATTMAASTCASRIYYSQRRGEAGVVEDVTEDEAMKAMIEVDFMGHPGVKSSHCQGAIGIMAVKKTKDGVFLFFGHNTDSFALASMSSEDKKPVCVMSRSNGHGSIAQGGRASRYKRYRILSLHDGSKQ
ncbi:hypothetical protein VTN02DRAFT_6866 [Thermoascus thermophilus]